MRPTKRHRSIVRRLTRCPGTEDARQALAAVVHYVGSPEHKDTVSFAGKPPRPRPDASICDRTFANQQERMNEWLKQAIQGGAFGEMMEGRFPRYVWYKDGDTLYEGRLVNREQGSYKGYPLLADEWPDGIAECYE